GVTGVAQHPRDSRPGDPELTGDGLHGLTVLVVHPCNREQAAETGIASHGHQSCTFVHRTCGPLHDRHTMAHTMTDRRVPASPTIPAVPTESMRRSNQVSDQQRSALTPAGRQEHLARLRAATVTEPLDVLV